MLRVLLAPVVVTLLALINTRRVVRSINKFLALGILLISSSLSVGQTKDSAQEVNNLRIWHSPNSTRVVFDVSANVEHTMFVLQNPLRLVVDIENADLKIQLPTIDVTNSHINAVRSGRPSREKLRFVFELKKSLQSSSFLLSPNELYGHRLVVDLAEKAAGVDATAQAINQVKDLELTPLAKSSEVVGSDKSTKESSLIPAVQAPAALIAPQKLIIAVDAGHGGEDPGAIGHRGSREKKITLAIARRLANKINNDSRMRAVLIRDGDYYVDLEKRRTTARRLGADIFISIHADAFRKKSARGLSVFALSQRGATSAMARALAVKENASDLIGGVSLAHKDQVLAQVLVDLSMTNTVSESVNLGGRVLKQLGQVGRLHSKRVEQAGFVVLKSPDMPSILVETGFITNPDEERRLTSSSYQNKIAEAIYKAVDQYYEQTPHFSNATYASRATSSSGIAKASNSSNNSANSNKQIQYHKVVRGDSLSKIAERYRISLRELKRVNGLRSNTAVLGKRLKLPKGARNASGSSSSDPNNTRPSVHIVKSGDSLSKISARYNVTIRFLKRLNNLTKNTLYLGQKIKLSGSTAASSSVRSKPIVHKVKRGDTLSEIADKYGSSIAKIKVANQLRSGVIRLGQILNIPN